MRRRSAALAEEGLAAGLPPAIRQHRLPAEEVDPDEEPVQPAPPERPPRPDQHAPEPIVFARDPERVALDEIVPGGDGVSPGEEIVHHVEVDHPEAHAIHTGADPELVVAA